MPEAGAIFASFTKTFTSCQCQIRLYIDLISKHIEVSAKGSPSVYLAM